MGCERSIVQAKRCLLRAPLCNCAARWVAGTCQWVCQSSWNKLNLFHFMWKKKKTVYAIFRWTLRVCKVKPPAKHELPAHLTKSRPSNITRHFLGAADGRQIHSHSYEETVEMRLYIYLSFLTSSEPQKTDRGVIMLFAFPFNDMTEYQGKRSKK